MSKIVYYVASSLDGYICGPNEDISRFLPSGSGIDQYLADLQQFKTVIMGRRTYEFGYQYGLKPGQAIYPHMEHHIFSNNLVLDNSADNVSVKPISLDQVGAIRRKSTTDVYLCGGGQFAGWLLENGMLDQLKLKLNPIILGEGTPLFGNSTKAANWKLVDRSGFDDGLQILTYDFVA
ncbi:MAG: dihydrofolate reductase family protein [Bacteroidota bacterium]